MAAQIVRVRTEDNRFQRLEVLKRNRTKRHRYGEFFVEGVKAITNARLFGWEITDLAYAAGGSLSGWARDTLAAVPNATRIELPPTLMERLSERDEPSELIAVVGMPDDSLARIALGRHGNPPLGLVFDRPSSPGNLGSIVRSCDALGADGLIVTGHGADVYDPQTVRASMGSLFSVPVVWCAGPPDVQRWVNALRASGQPLQIVGASGDGTAVVDAVDLTRPTLLVVGNETRGLSSGFRTLCDVLVRIPMSGAADSLNVAAAASILLYEANRQRRAVPPAPH